MFPCSLFYFLMFAEMEYFTTKESLTNDNQRYFKPEKPEYSQEAKPSFGYGCNNPKLWELNWGENSIARSTNLPLNMSLVSLILREADSSKKERKGKEEESGKRKSIALSSSPLINAHSPFSSLYTLNLVFAVPSQSVFLLSP